MYVLTHIQCDIVNVSISRLRCVGTPIAQVTIKKKLEFRGHRNASRRHFIVIK